ncbi:MAG: porin, partial [Rhodobacteraceae bacterium]|nr:porin [Paracoccaceae bacterium]
MKRLVLATTSLVVAGGMAAADVAVTGSAELGVSGKSGEAVQLHRDIRVKFGLSGATDTGLSFGASADFHNAGKYRAGGSEGAVHVTGAFGTLTLGNTDGGFDKALSEVGSATAIADDHTSHPGYNGNSGLDGFTGNGGGILRYDYSLGGVTASVSGEFNAGDSSNSAIGVGSAWSGDVGGVGMGVGIGFQSGSGKMEDIMGTPSEMLTPAEPAKAAVAQMARVTKGSSTQEVREWQCQATEVNDGDTPDDPSDDTLHPVLAGFTPDENTVCMDELDTANNEVEGVT